LTDPGGAYAISLPTGLYEVSYRHDGYFPYVNPSDVYVPSTPLELDDVTLEPGSYIELSGRTGTRTITTGSVVRITGYTYVGQYDSLFVEPGVTFRFAGYYQFKVSGYGEFMGTEADSIIFESEAEEPGPNSYDRVEINAGTATMEYCAIRHCQYLSVINGGSAPATTTSHFRHCLVSGCSWGIRVDSQSLVHFTDCVSERNTFGGIRVTNCSGCGEDVLFERCTVRDMPVQDLITVSNGSSPWFVDCVLEDTDPGTVSHAVGVEAGGSSPLLRNCIIRDAYTAGVVMDMDTGDALVERCLITGNAVGVSVDFSVGTIRNNTIVGNTSAGIVVSGGGTVDIDHNILADNGVGITLDADVGLVAYNDFWDNGVDYDGSLLPTMFGELVAVNGNGDPADIYLNIFLDPLFIDAATGDFGLTGNSPCIDAGDPARFDPDATVVDLGAFYFDHTTSDAASPPSRGVALLSNAPNPFNPRTEIRFRMAMDSVVALDVFDLRGRLVRRLVAGARPAGDHAVVWDGRDDDGRLVPSGTYFSRLRARGANLTGKMVLVR
jgi:hypothetical protein